MRTVRAAHDYPQEHGLARQIFTPRDLGDDRNSPPIYVLHVAMSHSEALSRPTIGDLGSENL